MLFCSLQKPLSNSNTLGDAGLCIGPTRGLSIDGKISPRRRKKKEESDCNVKEILHYTFDFILALL